MKYKIVISHASNDEFLAQIWKELFIEIFGENSVDLWFAADMGADRVGDCKNTRDEPFAATIVKNVKNAKIVIILHTPWSRLRPWVLWEAGIAKGSERPSSSGKIFIVDYKSETALTSMRYDDAPDHPFDSFQIYSGLDSKNIKFIIGSCAKKLSLTFIESELTEPLERYQEKLKAFEDHLAREYRRLDKWIEIRMTSGEGKEFRESKLIPDTSIAYGTLDFLGLGRSSVEWSDVRKQISAASEATQGGPRWIASLENALLDVVSGKISEMHAEGLPLLYVKQTGHYQSTSYRPLISRYDRRAGIHYFRIIFATIPKHLTCRPPGSAGKLTHLLEYLRLVRWAILENPESSSDDLIKKLADIRADFYGRGLNREDVILAFPEQQRVRVKELLMEYFAVLEKLSPETEKSPFIITEVIPKLKSINKEFFIISADAYLKELMFLDDGSGT